MQYKELDDLYRPGRTLWLPIVIGLAIVAVTSVVIMRNRAPKEATDGTPVAPTTASDSPAKPGSVTEAVRNNSAPSRPAAPAYPAPELNAALAEARALQDGDKLPEARDKLLALVEDGRSLGALQPQVEERLAAIQLLLVTTPRRMPGKVDYIILRGDSLSKIAAKFNCPAELIQKANGISDGSVIRPGDVLRVLERPAFAIEISKSNNTLLLTLGGHFFKRYRVGTGVFGKTPVGTFIIRDKIVDPPWWRANGNVIPFGDPENILGTRWMALEASGETQKIGGYGIHGTWNDASIGSASSAGCIRMHNGEVEELFMLVPRGTPVTIRE